MVVSYIAIFAVAGFILASAVIISLPTAVALFMKPSEQQEEMILVRAKAHDMDEDR